MEKLFRSLKGLAEREGIHIEEVALPKPLRGFIDKRPGRPSIILLDSRLTVKRKTETLAHELAHHFLNHGNLIKCQDAEKVQQAENEADNFARALMSAIA
jgi:Zn-dependent peptidase ImmA (M78 family)